ncbi:MAG: hypothetical protein ACKPKO_27685, partial [Candidatus Fonsibacter sp.]
MEEGNQKFGKCLEVNDVTMKKRQRAKESAPKRRERRLRADMRTFTRLVKSAQSAASHHTRGSLPVQ